MTYQYNNKTYYLHEMQTEIPNTSDERLDRLKGVAKMWGASLNKTCYMASLFVGSKDKHHFEALSKLLDKAISKNKDIKQHETELRGIIHEIIYGKNTDKL